MSVQSYEVANRRYKITIDGTTHDMSKERAEKLYEDLHKVLGKPPLLRYHRCDDRYSHGPHAWGKDGLNYCAGRSFDAT